MSWSDHNIRYKNTTAKNYYVSETDGHEQRKNSWTPKYETDGLVKEVFKEMGFI
jgi:hypothetical protein